jgi:hypothetical protein
MNIKSVTRESKNRFVKLISGIFITGLFVIPMTANATLIGSTVNVDWYFPDSSTLHCTSGTAVVGAGVEYASGCLGFSPVSIDISDNVLAVDTGGISWSSGSFNGFLLSVLDGPSILSAVYTGGSMGYTGLTIDAEGLWVDFAGTSPGGIAYFDLTTENVSEPTTLALLGLGLAGIGFNRKRKGKAA